MPEKEKAVWVPGLFGLRVRAPASGEGQGGCSGARGTGGSSVQGHPQGIVCTFKFFFEKLNMPKKKSPSWQ